MVIVFKSELIFDKLGEPLFRCVIEDENGTTVKTLTVSDYLRVISGATESVGDYMTVGKVSKHYFNSQISGEKVGCFKVLVNYPKQKRAFAYMGEHFYIPFPALMFFLHYEEGVRKEFKVFALDTDTPDNDSQLYEYPFGNVGQNGSVCFGNIKLPPVHDMSDVDLIVEEFLLGKTKNDLYHSQNAAGLSQGELVTYLQDKDEFPNELLKLHKVTQGDLLQTKKGGSSL